MEYLLKTPLNGCIAFTNRFHQNSTLVKDRSLYKFIWVIQGKLSVEIDHVPMLLHENEIITLSPLHHYEVTEVEGEYLSILFNSNFYCIYGHDSEVSCNGFLFNGSSHIMHICLNPDQMKQLNEIVHSFLSEYSIQDDLQEEMLRIALKRFIIAYTRIAREHFSIDNDNVKSFNLVRQFYVLVDNHYKEKKQVQEYADLLFRSPKTLSNLFASYGLPTPLQVIHERILAEAKRLLLYTSKSAKEIGDILGFEDIATFSRFFKKMTKQNLSEFRKQQKEE